ncbi:MAG TPA: hypothetical protein VF598_09595 [Hymenobacter sp.]|jgi:hypothetical protein
MQTREEPKLPNKKITILLAVLGLVLGWISCEAYHYLVSNQYNYFSIEKDINIIDVFTLLGTVFLAYYIPAVIDRRGQNTRVEKDIILGKINEYNTAIEDLMRSVRSGSIDYSGAAASLQNVTLLIARINRYATKIGISIETHRKAISIQVRQIRNLITGTLTQEESQEYLDRGEVLPLSVIDNKITFSKARINEIMREEILLENHVFNLIMSVNRHDSQ